VGARREPGGRLAAGIAARLAVASEAEQAPEALPEVAAVAVGGSAAAAAGGSGGRWARPAAGFAIAAGVAALSVFWLQGRPSGTAVLLVAASDGAASGAAAPAGAVPSGVVEVIAPPVATRGAGAEVVVAGNGYPGPTAYPGPAARGPGSGEPESYVVPIPAPRGVGGPPAQLANYAVAHSEFSAPLSRRSLLSALVASDAAAAPEAEAPAASAPESGEAGAVK
jgi:hypothetical protein